MRVRRTRGGLITFRSVVRLPSRTQNVNDSPHSLRFYSDAFDITHTPVGLVEYPYTSPPVYAKILRMARYLLTVQLHSSVHRSSRALPAIPDRSLLRGW